MLRLVVFLLFAILRSLADIQILIDQNGGYNITINNKLWLRSARTAIYADDQWYSTDNNSLPLLNITTGQGTDPYLGSWNETKLSYSLVRNQTTTTIVAHIRQWSSIPAFTFHLETGDTPLTYTIPLKFEEIRTVFPSFFIEKIDINDQRGYFTVGGGMAGWPDRHAGLWNSSSGVIREPFEDGPVALFDLAHRGETDVLILSPLSHFMATSLSQRNRSSDASLEYGIVGSISTIPANYMQSFMLFYSTNGINRGIREWGETMQRAFNRTNQYRLNDRTVNYLGYYTNNGGYYYYNTEPGINYEQTIIDVAHQLQFPNHYIEFDSWWYYKGTGGGVSEWRALPDVFPDGLVSVHHRLGNISLAAHNRWWAYDNVYKEKYAFAVDPAAKKALPIGNDSFWVDFFAEARTWGLVTYVQDWLEPQTRDFSPTRTDINIGEQWLKSMGAGAEQIGMNIQYCMSLPRHFLQALGISRVTHARASADYAVSLMNHVRSQWQIGITSMFLDAIGIAPFKDVLWTASTQPGSPYSSNASEVLPDRQILISTLSTGPVAVGDGINLTNIERIMRCCRQDGLILKPDRALTAINQVVADYALNVGISQGELYSTETTIDERTFHVVFASAMKKDYSVYPSMIQSDESGIIWSYDNVQVTSMFNNTYPLQILANQCDDLSVCVWYVSPIWQFNDVLQTKYALLGELNKWAAVSRQRFVSITTNTEKTQATIVVQGIIAETVSIGIYHAKFQSMIVNCTMSSTTGRANLIITPTNVVCS